MHFLHTDLSCGKMFYTTILKWLIQPQANGVENIKLLSATVENVAQHEQLGWINLKNSKHYTVGPP